MEKLKKPYKNLIVFLFSKKKSFQSNRMWNQVLYLQNLYLVIYIFIVIVKITRSLSVLILKFSWTFLLEENVPWKLTQNNPLFVLIYNKNSIWCNG